MITAENSQKRSLGSRSPLNTTETEVVAGTGEVTKVPEKVLEPEAGTLADGGELRRLVMGVAKSSKVFVLDSKLREFVDYIGELGEDNVEALFEEDEVCVVGAVTAGSYADVEDMSIGHFFCIF